MMRWTFFTVRSSKGGVERPGDRRGKVGVRLAWQ
jgi:hypothetical protein